MTVAIVRNPPLLGYAPDGALQGRGRDLSGYRGGLGLSFIVPQPDEHAGRADRSAISGGRRLLWRAAILGVVIGVVFLTGYVLIKLYASGYDLSGKAIADFILSLGGWGYAAIIGLMIVHSFVPFPAEVIAIAAGMCYGVIWGTLLVWIGAMLGASASFWLARWFGRPLVALLVAEKHGRKLDRMAREQSTNILLISRFIPLIAFNLINYAAGLAGVRWRTFLWTTALGILPLTTLMAAMGEQMRDPALSDWLIFAGAGLAIWLVVVLAKRRIGMPGRNGPAR